EVAPLQHQAAEDNIDARVHERQAVCVPTYTLKAVEQPLVAPRLFQHAGGEIQRDHQRLPVFALQGGRGSAGARAQIEHHVGAELERVQPTGQLVRNTRLQDRRRLVAGARLVEGPPHGARMEAERLGVTHGSAPADAAAGTLAARAQTRANVSTSESTCASVCAAESVTRRRALPRGTVGGRIATTQKPDSISSRCARSAAREFPNITGWMGVIEAPSGTPSCMADSRNRAV